MTRGFAHCDEAMGPIPPAAEPAPPDAGGTDPRAAFKTLVAAQKRQLEQPPESKARRGVVLLATQQEEFLRADYNPSVMIYFCLTITVGYAAHGFTTMRNNNGFDPHLHRLHFAAFYAEAALSAVVALLLLCPGRHTPVIQRHYQALVGALICVLCSLNHVQRAAAEQRHALTPGMWATHVNKSLTVGFAPEVDCTDRDPWASGQEEFFRLTSEDAGCESRFTGALSLGVQACYFIILAPARLRPGTAAAVVTCNSVSLLLAVIVSGSARTGGAQGAVRCVLFLMTLGGSSVFLCGVRHANAFAKWMASRRVAEVAASRANFLCCLMPPRVFNSRMSAPIAADEPLVVEPLQDIFVMFCSLPDFASMGAKCTPEELFALLNKVFSVFDQHVSKLALFKYHHISNSYVVTSRRAALVPPPEDLRLHTELSDFLLLADRLQKVVQDFNAPGTDTPLQLCCGIHVGDLSGAVVGKTKRFYCLFGDAMNIAARLCSQAPPGGGILCSTQILEVLQRNTFFRSVSAQDATQLVPERRGAGEAVHLRSMPPLLPPPSPDDCAQPASISAAADTDLSGSTSESTRGQGCGGHVLALGESFTSSLPVGSVRSGCSLDISVTGLGERELKGKGRYSIMSINVKARTSLGDAGVMQGRSNTSLALDKAPWLQGSVRSVWLSRISIDGTGEEAPHSAHARFSHSFDGSQTTSHSNPAPQMEPSSENETADQRAQRRRYAISPLTNDFVDLDTRAAYLSAVLMERQRKLVAGFFTFLVILCTFLHGMTSLDRLRVPEGAPGYVESRAAFEVTIGLCVPLIVLTSGGLAAALASARLSHQQRYSTLESDAAEERATVVWPSRWSRRGFIRFDVLVVLLIALKVCHVVTAIGLFFATNADGWCLSFTLYSQAIHAFGNGLTVKQNTLFILPILVLVCSFTLATSKVPVFSIILRLIVHVAVALLCAASARIEQRLSQSRFIFECLVVDELERMKATLEDLVPKELLDMVVSASEVSLPMTKTYSCEAVVLRLDLCNYTALAASISSAQLAQHIHALFSAFDTILSDTQATSNGLFKMDTIGDAYVAAAWLQDAQDGQTRNGERCQCLLDVAHAMIDAIACYNEEHCTTLECRIGMDCGPVTAGMQGLLQPRFHLLGPPVLGSEMLESQAQTNEVKMSEAVASLLSKRFSVALAPRAWEDSGDLAAS